MAPDQTTSMTDPEALWTREWLETNGLGGYASSTVAGANSRRYHGLLVASMRPPTERFLLLSKLEETLVLDGQRYDLSTNRYPGVVHPEGFRFLQSFRADPFPTYVYVVEGWEIEKSIFMVHGENTTVVQYRIQPSDHGAPDPSRKWVLEVRPLLAFRDYHQLTHENGAINPRVDAVEGRASLSPYPGLPTLYLAHNASLLEPEGDWYRNFEYDRERERGFDYHEDLFCPLVWHFREGEPSLIVSTQPHEIEAVSRLKSGEIERRNGVTAKSPPDDPILQRLTAAADAFLVAREDGLTVIAGYHWFCDWGRDTMIALPGLTLLTGRAEEARSILLAFSRYVDRGMLPNRFPDRGETPEYNTVDATLWYFEAIRAYLETTGDESFLKETLYPILREIVEWHIRGTRYGIRMDDDGLLRAGEAGTQLTWMDAKVGDWVITPRIGKPVEIQALWHNALRSMALWAGRFGDAPSQKRYEEIAGRAARSFNDSFWNDEAGCLYDVIDDDRKDGSIRPNQILAVSLPHPMILPDRAKSVVEAVRHELLTPVGLRTLSRDPHYRGRYEGDSSSRDSAYHQGTVWPWLMGTFVTAYLQVNGRNAETLAQVSSWLDGFRGGLEEAGIDQISEIFDGDPPHSPRGCIAQAWSVAEILRSLHLLRDAAKTGEKPA